MGKEELWRKAYCHPRRPFFIFKLYTQKKNQFSKEGKHILKTFRFFFSERTTCIWIMHQPDINRTKVWILIPPPPQKKILSIIEQFAREIMRCWNSYLKCIIRYSLDRVLSQHQEAVLRFRTWKSVSVAYYVIILSRHKNFPRLLI